MAETPPSPDAVLVSLTRHDAERLAAGLSELSNEGFEEPGDDAIRAKLAAAFPGL